MSDASKYRIERNNHGFYQAVPTPSKEELKDFYEKKYFQECTSSYQAEYSEAELSWFSNKAAISRKVAESLTSGRSFLDVGCGEGHFANYFHASNWLTRTWDFSSFAISKFNPHLMDGFSAGDIYELIDRYQDDADYKFDFVNLTNVLEHVTDPALLLNNLASLLKPGGVLSICVPNDFSKFQEYLVASGHTTATWVSPPQHLNYFDTESLPQLMRHCGYEQRELLGDFPIEQFLINPHSNYWQDKSLGKGAHHSRVAIDNFLCSVGIEKYVEYLSAAAKLGWGRNITIFAQRRT